ncbi:MAG: hypothetical protein ABJD68_19790 [Nakamurella sp.]
MTKTDTAGADAPGLGVRVRLRWAFTDEPVLARLVIQRVGHFAKGPP